MKAANPDYKIGEIAKVIGDFMYFGELCLYVCRRLWGRCGRNWTRKPRYARSMLVFLVYELYDHSSFKAPYEKKAEAAKKKYAEEMAAYEAK